MAKFVIGSKSGKTYFVEKEVDALLNKRLSERVEGDSIGFPGYEFEITGGSDKQGFPMRRDLPGTRRARPILTKSVGMRKKNVRERKTVRGNTISEETIQVNLKITKEGPKKLEEIFGEGAVNEQKTA